MILLSFTMMCLLIYTFNESKKPLAWLDNQENEKDITASAHPTLCTCVEIEGHISNNPLYLKKSDWRSYGRRK